MKVYQCTCERIYFYKKECECPLKFKSFVKIDVDSNLKRDIQEAYNNTIGSGIDPFYITDLVKIAKLAKNQFPFNSTIGEFVKDVLIKIKI